MSFSLLKHYLDLNITDTALKVSQSWYYFTTSISHGVENYFPRLWGTDISDAMFLLSVSLVHHWCCKLLFHDKDKFRLLWLTLITNKV